MSGSATRRSTRHSNPAAAAVTTSSDTTCGDVQAYSLPAQVSTSKIATTPTIVSVAPAQSIAGRARALCAVCESPYHRAPSVTRHSGTLTRKIQRHDHVSDRIPPIEGPIALAVA